MTALGYSSTSFNNFSNFEGDFDNLPQVSPDDREMLKDAYKAVTELKLWDWLRNPNVPGVNGFMFSDSPELTSIVSAMKYKGHSGTSFAYTMHVMKKIAMQGWGTYASETV